MQGQIYDTFFEIIVYTERPQQHDMARSTTSSLRGSEGATDMYSQTGTDTVR